MTRKMTVSSDHRKSKFVLLLQKNKAWLTLVGALIVFLGYFAKEVQKEHTKELKDDLSTAKVNFEARKDSERLYNEIIKFRREVRSSMSDLSSGIRSISEKQTNSEAASEEPEDLWWSGESAEQAAIRLAELNEKLPDADENKSHLIWLRNRLHSINEDAKDGNAPFVTKVTEAKYKIELDQLEILLIEKAETQNELNEHHFRFWTAASIALYIVGWSMALIGNITGIKLEGEKE